MAKELSFKLPIPLGFYIFIIKLNIFAYCITSMFQILIIGLLLKFLSTR